MNPEIDACSSSHQHTKFKRNTVQCSHAGCFISKCVKWLIVLLTSSVVKKDEILNSNVICSRLKIDTTVVY